MVRFIFKAIFYRLRWIVRFLLCRLSNLRGGRNLDRAKIHREQRENWTNIVSRMEDQGTQASHAEHWKQTTSLAISFIRNSPAICLEIGCESGWFGAHLKEHFPEIRYVGADLLPPTTLHNRMVLADAQQLPFAAQKFDLIVARHVVEHIPNPGMLREELRRTALPNASILLALPLGYDRDPCHCWHFMTPKGWTRFLRKNLELEMVEGCEFGTVEKEFVGSFRML